MSGIFGIIHRDGCPVEVADLERMRFAMAHRGPDGSAIWRAGEAGLGQLMLHSTPESLHETLPWQDPESGLVITADARIDNRDELASTLGLSARQLQSDFMRDSAAGRFATESLDSNQLVPDSWLILQAYRRWDEACVDHLLGDFAFAIWNPRNRQLFCARDHMGIRPFYYYLDDRMFVFASAAQSVVAASGVPVQISDERVADFLVFQLEGVDNRCTFFRDVWRLPPASFAVCADNHFRIAKYWQPDAEFELQLDSEAAYIQAFRDVLEVTVKARLRCNRGPASMLSGGIDSSTIVGLSREILADSSVRLKTYSGVAEDEDSCRETANIRRVIAQGGLDATTFTPPEVAKFTDDLLQVARRTEDPFDSHSILFKILYSAARTDGCTVVMDGLDGDGIASLTSIYPCYLVRDGHWVAANREIRGMWENYYQSRFPLWRDYLSAIKPMLAPGFVWRMRARSSQHRLARAAIENCHISETLAKKVDLAARFAQYQGYLGPGLAQSLRHAQLARVQVPFLSAAVERYGRLAAACGVEPRHPLLDKRVVEFCVALPWQYKCRNGWSKYLLRRVAEQVAPTEVAWRRGWDVNSWKFMEEWETLQYAGMRGFLEQQFSRYAAYVDGVAIDRALGAADGAKSLGDQEQIVFYLLEWLEAQQQRQKACNTIFME